MSQDEKPKDITWARDRTAEVLEELTPEEQDRVRKFAEAMRVVAMRKGEKRLKRSTLSVNNTVQMLPYIRHAAKVLKDFEIPCFPNVRLQTMYIKWMGALQHLIEGYGEDQEMQRIAAALRAITLARKDEARGCLTIVFKVSNPSLHLGTLPAPREVGADSTAIYAKEERTIQSPLRKQADAILAAAMTETSSWKADFIEWVQSGDPDKPFMRDKLLLSQDDIQFVTQIAQQNDWLCEATMTTIKVTKT